MVYPLTLSWKYSEWKGKLLFGYYFFAWSPRLIFVAIWLIILFRQWVGLLKLVRFIIISSWRTASALSLISISDSLIARWWGPQWTRHDQRLHCHTKPRSFKSDCFKVNSFKCKFQWYQFVLLRSPDCYSAFGRTGLCMAPAINKLCSAAEAMSFFMHINSSNIWWVCRGPFK